MTRERFFLTSLQITVNYEIWSKSSRPGAFAIAPQRPWWQIPMPETTDEPRGRLFLNVIATKSYKTRRSKKNTFLSCWYRL